MGGGTGPAESDSDGLVGVLISGEFEAVVRSSKGLLRKRACFGTRNHKAGPRIVPGVHMIAVGPVDTFPIDSNDGWALIDTACHAVQCGRPSPGDSGFGGKPLSSRDLPPYCQKSVIGNVMFATLAQARSAQFGARERQEHHVDNYILLKAKKETSLMSASTYACDARVADRGTRK